MHDENKMHTDGKSLKTSNEAGLELMNVLGIKSSHVTDITVSLKASGIVRVNVEFVMTRDQWAAIGQPQGEYDA